MSTLFGIAVGLFVGWNMPQPAWARELQDKVVAAIRKLGNKLDG